MTGAKSVAFWVEAETAVGELTAGILADIGYEVEASAPVLAHKAARAFARAEILAEACWWRVVESGGPMTSAGRTRRAFVAWERADRRAESWARIIGIECRQKPPQSVADYIASRSGGEV